MKNLGFFGAKFNVDYVWCCHKNGLAQWHHHGMGVWSWRIKMTKKKVSYLNFSVKDQNAAEIKISQQNKFFALIDLNKHVEL